VIAAGLLKWRILPRWLAVWAAAMGVVAMAVTMGFPEYPVLYLPVFHAFPLWMACMGVTILRSGLGSGASARVVAFTPGVRQPTSGSIGSP
jgi:hypothetical protein